MLDLPYGLAFPAPGEVINYPLRALRLSSYLATAGLSLVFAALEQPKQKKAQAQAEAQRAEARKIATSLVTLWEHNQGGCLSPVTDDQIIDISLAWELWLRLDMRQPPPDAANEWYTQGIEDRGTCKVFDLGADVGAFIKDFEAFNRPIPDSPAEAMGRPIVDRIAWKLWRTPAPMALFVKLMAALVPKAP